MNKICNILKAFVLTAAALCLASCKMNEVKVTSCDIAQVMPTGFRSARITLSLGVDNPAREFSVTDIQAVVKLSGEEAGILKADDVTVKARTSQTYTIPVQANLTGDALHSVFDVTKITDYSQVTVDFSATLRSGIFFVKKFQFTDIPLQEFANQFR